MAYEAEAEAEAMEGDERGRGRATRQPPTTGHGVTRWRRWRE